MLVDMFLTMQSRRSYFVSTSIEFQCFAFQLGGLCAHAYVFDMCRLVAQTQIRVSKALVVNIFRVYRGRRSSGTAQADMQTCSLACATHRHRNRGRCAHVLHQHAKERHHQGQDGEDGKQTPRMASCGSGGHVPPPLREMPWTGATCVEIPVSVLHACIRVVRT